MRAYGIIYRAFWTDDKVMALSERGKLLALYLLTGPHGSACGCFRVPDGYISADLGMVPGTVADTVAELVSAGFINRCSATGWTWVRNYIRYNPIANPNVGKAVWPDITAIPKNLPFYQEVIESLKPYAERFPEPLPEPTSNGMLNPIPSLPIPNPTLSRPDDAAPAAPRKRERAGIADLTPDAFVAYAAEHAPGVDIARELERFRNWTASKGRTHKDAKAAFRNWLLKAGEDLAKARGAVDPPRETPAAVLGRTKRETLLWMVGRYRREGAWQTEAWGDPPGAPGCLVPADVLAECGYGTDAPQKPAGGVLTFPARVVAARSD